MSDLDSVFNILADDTSGEGEAAISRIEGEAAAAIEGLIGFAFKDASGNVVLPQLDASGRVPTTPRSSADACKNARGEVTGSASFVDICDYDVTLGKVQTGLEFLGCCLQPTLFEVVRVDDAAGTPVETILAQHIVGPGQYSFGMKSDCIGEVDTTGGTGDQKIKLKGKNFFSPRLSRMRGAIGSLELA